MKLPPIAQVSISEVRGVFLFPTVQGYVKRESSCSSVNEHVIFAFLLISDFDSEASFPEVSSFLTALQHQAQPRRAG